MSGHALLHASLALARRVDRAEIDFCALASRAGTPGGADSLAVGGGRALFAHAGSPMNKVLGLGLDAPVTDDDLDAIDDFYDQRGVPAQVELCPLAAADVAPRLVARGYVLQGFENQLARILDPGAPPPAAAATGLAVAPVAPEDDETWVDVVSAGFAVGYGAPHDAEIVQGELRGVMRAFTHPSMIRYLVRADGNVAGGGALFVHEGVAGLVGTATLPVHRGRGVQHALVARMLRDAAAGADLAIATVAPGSQSQRTFERFGFNVIYTRAVLVRTFE